MTNSDLAVLLSNLLKNKIVKMLRKMRKTVIESLIGKESAVRLKATTSRLRQQTILKMMKRLS